MSKKWTNEEFQKILKERNPNLKALEIYQDASEPILFECVICGYRWKTAPREVTRLNEKKRTGCKKCSGKMRWTNEKFLEEVTKRTSGIKVLEEYKNYEEKIKVLCLKCNEIFYATPHSILSGNGCFNCYKASRTKANDTFIEELYKINENLQPLEDYINSYTKILIRCNICNHEWKAKPCGLLLGNGCPVCCISKGEKKILNYLKENDIRYIYDQSYFEDLKGINGGKLRPDFLLLDYKIWIEYDGEQHFQEVFGNNSFEVIKKHDAIKNKYAKENGWKLIRIPYWDYDNIEGVLEDFIKTYK